MRFFILLHVLQNNVSVGKFVGMKQNFVPLCIQFCSIIDFVRKILPRLYSPQCSYQLFISDFSWFYHLLSATTIHMHWHERGKSAVIIDRSRRWEGTVLFLERVQLRGTQVNNCSLLSQFECTLNFYLNFTFNLWRALNYSEVFNLVKRFLSYGQAWFWNVQGGSNWTLNIYSNLDSM